MDDLIIVLLCVAPFGWSWAFRRSMLRDKPRLAAIGMAMAFCFFAFGHVAIHGQLVRMLPPWVPERSFLIYATGLLELAIAVGLALRRWQRMAARAAMVVLVLFFPANVYAAFAGTWDAPGQEGVAYLWIRTPLQIFLLLWASWPAFPRRVGTTATRFGR